MPSRMDCRRMSAWSADEIAAGKDKNVGRKLIYDGLKMMGDGRKATMERENLALAALRWTGRVGAARCGLSTSQRPTP